MQINYTNDTEVDGKTYSVYAVIDGPKTDEYHLFDVYVNPNDLVINVRGLTSLSTGPMPLVPTTGVATVTSEMVKVEGSDDLYKMGKRVNGGSVRSYVTARAGRLTAMAYAVGQKLTAVTA